uniref:Uncharacterized protein n=1 Tax=Anguilla anguilla TaxID=7936 RepID=A0A0E9TWL5_ANGAN
MITHQLPLIENCPCMQNQCKVIHVK